MMACAPHEWYYRGMRVLNTAEELKAVSFSFILLNTICIFDSDTLIVTLFFHKREPEVVPNHIYTRTWHEMHRIFCTAQGPPLIIRHPVLAPPNDALCTSIHSHPLRSLQASSRTSCFAFLVSHSALRASLQLLVSQRSIHVHTQPLGPGRGYMANVPEI
ncbi:hypothetical protein BD779DRAFT_603486 [Infundibulicybe gibba]|nr:hypothetical protein BD779DRAFT_603486 [Infundibulicybe gibba]